MKNTTLAAIVCFLCLGAFYACKKSDNSSNNTNGFDKTAMVAYYADSIIIPGYAAMDAKIAAVDAGVDAFIASPSASSLTTIQAAYMEARMQYVRIAPFQFGPAETALLDLFVNYSGGLDYNFNTAGTLTGFSIDTVTIESNIANGGYNLAAMTRNSFYSQGFPALDYLLFGQDALNKLSTSPARRTYLKDVVTRMKDLFLQVSSGWGAYRSTFVSNTQTNVGSPIGNMVNQLAYQMDVLKGPRIGWPFGKQSNNIVFATKVEAYYAGISVALATESLKSLKKLYTANGSGKGLSNYIVALGNETLNNDVLAQFDIAIDKLQAIPDPLSSSLTAEQAKVDAAYKEIQKLLTLLKTDVASATAVQITFMDNDGD